jgi:hypothetical protein
VRDARENEGIRGKARDSVLAGQRPYSGSDQDRREPTACIHTAEAAGSKPAAPTQRRRSTACAFAAPERPSLASQNNPRIVWRGRARKHPNQGPGQGLRAPRGPGEGPHDRPVPAAIGHRPGLPLRRSTRTPPPPRRHRVGEAPTPRWRRTNLCRATGPAGAGVSNLVHTHSAGGASQFAVESLSTESRYPFTERCTFGFASLRADVGSGGAA